MEIFEEGYGVYDYNVVYFFLSSGEKGNSLVLSEWGGGWPICGGFR